MPNFPKNFQAMSNTKFWRQAPFHKICRLQMTLGYEVTSNDSVIDNIFSNEKEWELLSKGLARNPLLESYTIECGFTGNLES